MRKHSRIVRKFIGSFLVTISFLGCNNFNKDLGTNDIHIINNKNPEEWNAQFKVQIFAIIPKNDSFDFFYVLDSLGQKFHEDKKAHKQIQGSADIQMIEFAVPGNRKALKFRIDLGRNREQSKIKIVNVKLIYGHKIVEIPGELTKYFFNENKYISYGTEKGTLNQLELNEKWNPFITSSALLNKRIKIEF